MKIASRYFVAAALMAAPVSVAAQTTQPPAAHGEHAREGQRGERGHFRGERGPGMGSPVQRMLAQRERLKLTDAQVQRLEAIDRDLQSRNAPLHQQLATIFPERAARGPRPEGARPQGERRARPDSAQRAERRRERPQLTEAQREQMRQRREQARPVMEQLRQSSEAALTQARSVLTAEQQQMVRERMERRSGRGEGRRGERPRGADQSR